MQSENCPNCGAEVIFRSPALPARICDYCHATVKRIAEGVEKAGEVAVLPFDVSPVQIGTTGEYGGKHFDVIGRIRLGYDQGAWNDWLCFFTDNSYGWLSESDGQFQMVIERPIDGESSELIQRLAQGGDVEIGERTTIDGSDFVVAEARWAKCIGAEGELPFAPETDWDVFNVDLRDAHGFAANFEREEGEPPAFYVGRYVTLAELKAKNLRAIHGWKMPVYG
jgi:hypothetical protein